MDNSDPEVQVVSNSQVLGSSCSLSLPSEPPDIRNWFSSYEYESPVLDLNHNFVDSVSKESEFVKNELVINESGGGKEVNPGGTGKRDQESVKCSSFFGNDKHESQSFSKLADSLHSTSLLSEPPDIRNWFSSYVYNSPVLGTNDFGDSLSKEIECENDEFDIEETDLEKEETLGEYSKSKNRGEVIISEKMHSNGFVKSNSCFMNNEKKERSSREFLLQVADSLHSTSLLSEPPDIRNWFSSYVYESPVLGTNDFGDSLSKEIECENDEFDIEETDLEKEETLGEYSKSKNRGEVNIGEKLHSNGFVKSNSCFMNNEQKEQSSREGDNRLRGNENASSQKNSSFEQSLNFKIKQNHGVRPTKDVSSLNDEDSQSKNEQPQKIHCMPLDIRTSGSGDRKSPKRLIHSRGAIQECSEVKVKTEDVECVSPESKSKLNLVNGIAMTKSTHGRSGKENAENISENGFVATRKMSLTRTNDENSFKSTKGITKGTVPSAGGNVGVVKRKVLTETTNFQHSDAMAVTGKWRCPQKSKPNLGPPLKQLRLEQWVRRV
ncbi:uncharacterized protein LOC115970733 isoform X1 [Quercus lobata]|uniref:uncharacterized protein LOC115970733 isoform X1 n=1 Tax=Quercus lobata TaxID=97700 RepID=UPI001247E0C1|nr:uncharacterized protein LOC115970733 isoform X1 [Quercus lobata]